MNIFGRYRNYKIGLIILILAVNVIGLFGPNHGFAAVSIFFGFRHIWPYLAYLGTYMGASNMVKWVVPEKILQNAV